MSCVSNVVSVSVLFILDCLFCLIWYLFCPVFCVYRCCQCLCVVHSWLSLLFTLVFILSCVLCIQCCQCLCVVPSVYSSVYFVLCLVYPMLSVSLCCSFLIVPSVYSSVYFVLCLVYPLLFTLVFILSFVCYGVDSVSVLFILDCPFCLL